MFHLIGVVVVVILVLAFVGWLITPTPTVIVVGPEPDQEAPEIAGHQWTPEMLQALHVAGERVLGDVRQLDRNVQQVLGPADHRATIEEYRARLVSDRTRR